VEKLIYEPVLYQGAPWKEISYQWFIRDDLRDTHLVFPTSGQEKTKPPIQQSIASLDRLPRVGIDYGDCEINETIYNDTILIDTTCLNKPLLVKVSYHPNWRVEGADRIHLVSPSFMLIYPQQGKVRLTYGPGSWDKFGMVLTGLGILTLLLNVPLPGRNMQTPWALLAPYLPLPTDLAPAPLPVTPEPRSRWLILFLIISLAGGTVAWFSYQTYLNEPYRVFNRSIRFKDTGKYEEARAGFKNFMKTYPMAGLSRDAAYYIAITYYLEKEDIEARQAFNELIDRYPQYSRVPEAHYHIGMSLFRSNRQEDGRQKMMYVTKMFPQTPWAKYAAEYLKEHSSRMKNSAPDIHTGNLDQYLGKAVNYFNQDRLEEARPIFQVISDRYPGFAGAPQALAGLALIYYKQGDCLGTIENYKKLLERYPENKLAAEALFHLGICYERNGKKKLSTVYYKKLLDGYPDSVYGKQAAQKLIR
jgi:TolA-binding protein